MLHCYTVTDDHLIENADLTDPSILWFDLINPTVDEDRAVERQLGIAIPTREEMEEIELSSRLYIEDGAQFMTMTVITQLDSEEPARTPITFILKDKQLVTVRYADPKPFVNFIARTTKPEGSISAAGDSIMLGLLEAVVNRIADALEKSGAEIDKISQTVFRSKSFKTGKVMPNLQTTIQQIGITGDAITMLQESLVGLSRLVTYHAAVHRDITKDELTHTKMLQRDAAFLTEHVVFLSDKITFLLDATLGLINLEQNQIIKMFSVAAVVFLPPTLVASIYGMNFKHMPELDWITGYPYALMLMLVSAIIPYLYAKKRGWL